MLVDGHVVISDTSGDLISLNSVQTVGQLTVTTSTFSSDVGTYQIRRDLRARSTGCCTRSGAIWRAKAKNWRIVASSTLQFPLYEIPPLRFDLEWVRDLPVRGEKMLVYCSGENSS